MNLVGRNVRIPSVNCSGLIMEFRDHYGIPCYWVLWGNGIYSPVNIAHFRESGRVTVL